MINEVMSKKERLEENKLLEAIHNQAKWRNMQEHNKWMLAQMDKELKKNKIKEFKAYLVDDLFNFVLFVAFAIPTIMLLVVLCY